MRIRPLASGDDPDWLWMRQSLWPNYPLEQLRAEMRLYRADSYKAVFVAEADDGRVCGFLEFNLREFAEGCQSSPVGYVEGWHVDAGARRQGIGRALLAAAEAHARAIGCRELASDCHRENAVSRSAHLAAGFGIVERLIHFQKKL